MRKLQNNVPMILAESLLFTEKYECNHIICADDTCDVAGSVICTIPGAWNKETKTFEPDITIHYCPQHAGIHGFCHVCGDHIDGLACSIAGTLCSSCSMDFDDADFEDEHDEY